MATTPDRIPEGRIRLTYEDYCDLPDDGLRYEILDGELEIRPSPNIDHQRVSRDLVRILQAHVEARGLGEVFDAPCDVLLAATTIVVPDLVFVSGARAALVTKRAIEGAPDLLVEILSPSSTRRDRHTQGCAVCAARRTILLDRRSTGAHAGRVPGLRWRLPPDRRASRRLDRSYGLLPPPRHRVGARLGVTLPARGNTPPCCGGA